MFIAATKSFSHMCIYTPTNDIAKKKERENGVWESWVWISPLLPTIPVFALSFNRCVSASPVIILDQDIILKFVQWAPQEGSPSVSI